MTGNIALISPEQMGIALQPCVRIVGLYEDLAAGLRISRLCAHLKEEFGRALRFQVDIYSFQVLALPNVALTAAEKAEGAHALIVSTHQLADSPLRLRKWIRSVQLLSSSSVVQLGAAPGEDSQAHDLLWQLAQRVEAEHESELSGGKGLADEPAASDESLSVHAIDEEESVDVVHYGIND